ncbi:MAG: tail fiber domain-containing protein [Pyrinomonadaceae bacterium]|nr:tail fiber domain-containing protein [Pyrinomonadaceae bacterium]
MKKFITKSRPMLLAARNRSSRGVRRFSRWAAFSCALVALSLLGGGIGVAQGQQSAEALTIKDGNVGIGTVAPASRLSIIDGTNTVAGQQIRIGSNSGTTDYTFGRNPTTGFLDFSGSQTGSVGYTFSGGNVTVGKSTAGGNYAQDAQSGWRDGYMLFRAGAQKASIGMDSGGTKLQLFTGSTSEDSTARLTLDSSGNVGIGKTDPAKALDIFSTDSGFGMLRVNNNAATAGEATIGFFDTSARTTNTAWVAGVGGWGNTGDFVIGNQNGGAGGDVRLLIEKGGNVGIGTTTPTQGKLVINGSVMTSTGAYWYFTSGGSGSAGDQVQPYSIWASDRISASEFNARSDGRLKNVQRRSDSANDLLTLLTIEVTDYRYQDVIGNGDASHKKLIAQQVEKVFPQAVSKQTDVVPDIYQRASSVDGWVELATDLKKGERVRLISEKAEGVYEVLEAAKDRFRTDFKPDGGRVFVFGRQVNDFRTLDYDAVAMLNVSATQELKKEKDAQVKALQDENASLRSQLADQEKRLAAIETLLLSACKPAARTASLKKLD